MKKIIDNIRKRGRPKKKEQMVSISVRIYHYQKVKLEKMGDKGAVIRQLITDA